MKIWLTALVILITTSSFTHKFYVSNTLVEYNSRTHLIEITCKMFSDDLERALSAEIKPGIVITPGEQSPAVSQAICDYFSRQFKLVIDHQTVIPSCVGYESEYDLTYFYAEIPYTWDFKTMEVSNQLFMELFPEQKNIVDISNAAWRKTIILTREHPSEIITN